MFIVYYCLRNIQGPHYFPNRGYENLRKINTFSQFRQIFFTLKRDFEQRGTRGTRQVLSLRGRFLRRGRSWQRARRTILVRIAL